MVPLARFLARRGFTPINLGYFGPGGLQSSVDRVARDLATRLAPYEGRPVHFVTHSMGGIVARAYLGAHPWPGGGRIVQLAPPNQGSSLANKVRGLPLVGQVPALFDLGRHEDGSPRALLEPLEDYEVGVVAGRSFGPWHDGPSDGVVRVAETYLPEARDWILLEHFHTVIMNGADTRSHIEAFLDTGRFQDEALRLELDAKGDIQLRDAGAEALRSLDSRSGNTSPKPSVQ